MNKKYFWMLNLIVLLSVHNAYPSMSWRQYASQFVGNASEQASRAWIGTRNYIASLIPEQIKNTVNSWSTKKKIAVATAIIGSLIVAGYNKDRIVIWLKSIIEEPSFTDLFYKEKIANISPSIFNQAMTELNKMLGTFYGTIPVAQKAYLLNHHLKFEQSLSNPLANPIEQHVLFQFLREVAPKLLEQTLQKHYRM